jgi:UDP-glucose 4-epimerase
VRDYIHVCDLAAGHVAAVGKIDEVKGAEPFNLGTGQGYTVLGAIRAFEEVSGKTIPYRIEARRPGDVAACYADPSKARERLAWSAQLGLDAMCRDHWNWQVRNPNGYL